MSLCRQIDVYFLAGFPGSNAAFEDSVGSIYAAEVLSRDERITAGLRD